MNQIPSQGIKLLGELKSNNTREWYAEHKKAIEADLLEPCKAVVEEIRSRLEINLGQPMQVKLIRMHRDVRFSKDKSPYNTHVRCSIWPADQAQEVAVCYFLSFESDMVFVGVGMFDLGSKLTSFRSRCGELDGLLKPMMRVPEPELKRIPAGVENAHPVHQRRKSLTAWIDTPIPAGSNVAAPHEPVDQLTDLWKWMASL